jgi:hypothetical protein
MPEEVPLPTREAVCALISSLPPSTIPRGFSISPSSTGEKDAWKVQKGVPEYVLWHQSGYITCLSCHAARSGIGMSSALKLVDSSACLSAGMHLIRCSCGLRLASRFVKEFVRKKRESKRNETRRGKLTCSFLVKSFGISEK